MKEDRRVNSPAVKTTARKAQSLPAQTQMQVVGRSLFYPTSERENLQILRAAAKALMLLAFAAGSMTVWAGSARTDSTDTGQIVLQMKFKPGDVSRYQTNMQLGFTLPTPVVTSKNAPAHKTSSPGNALGGTTFTVNAIQDVKVRSVAANGAADLEVTTTGQNSLPGQPPVLSNDTRPVTMTYDAQGKLVNIRRPSETASSNPMFGAMLGQGLLSMQGVILPAKPVRIGEAWTQHIKIPGITGNGASTINTTLTKVETIDKYRTAHLHVLITTPVSAYLDAALQPTAKASEAASTMNGTATVTDEISFAIAEGKVIRSVSKGVTDMTVAIGRSSLPAKAPAKKKGTAAAPSAPAPQGQTLKMTVRTDIETNLVESPKK